MDKDLLEPRSRSIRRWFGGVGQTSELHRSLPGQGLDLEWFGYEMILSVGNDWRLAPFPWFLICKRAIYILQKMCMFFFGVPFVSFCRKRSQACWTVPVSNASWTTMPLPLWWNRWNPPACPKRSSAIWHLVQALHPTCPTWPSYHMLPGYLLEWSADVRCTNVTCRPVGPHV